MAMFIRDKARDAPGKKETSRTALQHELERVRRKKSVRGRIEEAGSQTRWGRAIRISI